MNHRNRRFTALVAMISAGVFTLAACGGSSEDESSSTLESLQDAGKVVVGINGEDPYSYYDKDDKLTGAVIALDRAVYKELGVDTVEAKEVEWDALIPGLNADQYDQVSAGMSILPERCEQADFSQPQIVYRTALLVAKGNPKGVETMQDLKDTKGVNVVTMNGAIEQGYADDMGIDTQTVGSPQDGLQAVENGRADVFALTAISLTKLVEKQNAGDKVEVTEPFTAVVKGKKQIGAGAAVFRKGDDELLEAYDEELAKIMSDPEKFESIVGEFGFTREYMPTDDDMNVDYLCSGELPDAE